MKREYWYILIAYTIMLFSGYLIVNPAMLIAQRAGVDIQAIAMPISIYWTFFSFTAALVLVLYLLRKEFKREDTLRGPKASLGLSVSWAVGGVFLAFIAQAAAISIENALGIKAGSENTGDILKIIEMAPMFIIVSSIIGPILEEIVFRKIIFGSIYKKTNFILAGLISSLIFGVAHGEMEHILIYTMMGFTFAFLYVKTNRILVPIIAHVTMNTLVVIAQFVVQDEHSAGQLFSIIGGFL